MSCENEHAFAKLWQHARTAWMAWGPGLLLPRTHTQAENHERCSLKIHIPRCQQKFEKEQQQKAVPRPVPAAPPELDEPLPTSAAEIDEFNNRMFDIYNNCSLTKCSGCGRSFNTEAYEKHVLRCTGSAAGAGPTSRPKTLPPTGNRNGATSNPGSKPRAYSCYLCAPILEGCKPCGV